MGKIKQKPIAKLKSPVALIAQCGEMWARNTPNIELIPRKFEGGQGVYILYDGSMPVYIGRGDIKARIRSHRDSPRLGQLWDHFSWYVLSNATQAAEIEALLLRMLPFYVRVLNRQSGKLPDVKRKKPQAPKKHLAEYISRKYKRPKSKRQKTKP